MGRLPAQTPGCYPGIGDRAAVTMSRPSDIDAPRLAVDPTATRKNQKSGQWAIATFEKEEAWPHASRNSAAYKLSFTRPEVRNGMDAASGLWPRSKSSIRTRTPTRRCSGAREAPSAPGSSRSRRTGAIFPRTAARAGMATSKTFAAARPFVRNPQNLRASRPHASLRLGPTQRLAKSDNGARSGSSPCCSVLDGNAGSPRRTHHATQQHAT
jgi:hypothetical protein